MNPYLTLLSARVRLDLQYRGAALMNFGTSVLFGLVRMMIFQAFYATAPAAVPMSLSQVIAYIWVSQALSGLVPFLGDHEVDENIRTGNVAYELLRPVSLYNMWFVRAASSGVVPVVLNGLPLLVLAGVLGWVRWPGLASVAAGAAMLASAVLLTSAITMLLNLTAFWTLSGHGMSWLVSSSMRLLSGLIIPLPLFPAFLQPLIHALPFRGLCDVPLRILTGQLPPSDLPIMLAQQLAWTVALIVLGRRLLAMGMRRVVIHGG